MYVFRGCELQSKYITFTNLGFHFPGVPSVHGATETALARGMTVGKETMQK